MTGSHDVRLSVRHITRYRYDEPVSSSYGQVCVLPRATVRQRCTKSSLHIDPVPTDERERLDFFGNRLGYFELEAVHEVLAIEATSEVMIDVEGFDLPPASQAPFRTAIEGLADLRDGEADVALYRLDSPRVGAGPQVRDYAASSFVDDRPIVDCVLDLASRIHRDFSFNAAATDVTSTIDDLFEAGAGVCQDFAHLAVAGFRSAGLPARYVSGYLETDPPPGSPKLVGADASHAWASVFIPAVGWVDVDPTNDQLVDDRYITIAWGRDYGDVAPVRGVIFSSARATSLEVAVDVTRTSSCDPIVGRPRRRRSANNVHTRPGRPATDRPEGMGAQSWPNRCRRSSSPSSAAPTSPTWRRYGRTAHRSSTRSGSTCSTTSVW